MYNKDNLNDILSVLILCHLDGTIFTIIEGTEYLIPSIRVSVEKAWTKLINREITELFNTKPPTHKLLALNKFWVPDEKIKYVQDIVFLVEITDEMRKKMKPSIKYKRIKWCTEDDIVNNFNNNNLRNVSMLDYISLAKRRLRSSLLTLPAEVTFIGNLFEMTSSAFIMEKNTVYEELVYAAGINHPVQQLLYNEFLNMCYPSYFMSFVRFTKFLSDTGWEKDEATALFRAADLMERNALSYRELLYFLAVVEPNTPHNGSVGQLRCQYIFRYFNKDRNNVWSADEFRKFVIYSRRLKKLPIDTFKVERELSSNYGVLQIPNNSKVDLNKFLQAVSELKIRGTSHMLRASINIKTFLKKIGNVLGGASKRNLLSEGGQFGKGKLDSPDCNFDLAIHTLQFDQSALNIKVHLLTTFQLAVSSSSTRDLVPSEPLRQSSMNTFDEHSISNELLNIIKILVVKNKKYNSYESIEKLPKFIWSQADAASFAKLIITVSGEVKEIFMKEKRLLKLSSPVYIMGDLHGNFNNLLIFEKLLWPHGMSLCPSKFLFLGDYVDRGFFGLEVVSYLFAYKLQCPTKLFLVRGNHEIRKIQSQYTFEKELQLKLGDKLGNSVWTSINEAFDAMPLAAVVDSKLFCVHGGIPPPWLCPTVSVIDDIPPILSQPQEQSNLAWELMWNDPISTDELTNKINMELSANEGFAKNHHRGTAHIFNNVALDNFLKINKLSHLIRAHEVVEAGFYIKLKGKSLTVFSSFDCTTSACLLADQWKLRIIKFTNV